MKMMRIVALTSALTALPSALAAQQLTSITVDGPAVQQQLEANDPQVDGQRQDLYALPLRAGESIQVDLIATDFDPYLQIVAPGGEEPAAENDDGGSELNARLRFTAPEAGTYTIRARGLEGGTGAYTLAVKRRVIPPAPTPVTLTAGTTLSGQFGDATPLDEDDRPYALYRLRGRAGARVQIDMIAADFDSYLRLRREGGGPEIELTDDDSGDELNARLVAELPADGEYLLTATALAEGQGAYQVAYKEYMPSRAPAPPVKLSRGQTVNGSLAFDDPDMVLVRPENAGSTSFGKLYAIDVRAGEVVTVDLSGDFDPVLDAGGMSPIGFAVAQTNDDRQQEEGEEESSRDSQLVLRPTQAGTIYLRARSFDSSGMGKYQLTVSN